MIQVSSFILLLAALLLLILPLDWILAILIAAAFHELCHILALYFLNGSILRVEVRMDGCVIESDRIGEWKQFVSVLAGPLGSFALLFLCRVAPKIAICGLFQGLYNLIPILPLDGGRMLRLILYHFCPGQADSIMEMIAFGICIIFDILAICLSSVVSAGSWPILFAVVWNIKFLSRKIPCKWSKIGVQ